MFSFKRKYYQEKSDEELVTLFKNEKNSLCFGILYERYAHLVMGTCMKYLKNPSAAEDLTMQIFESLHYKLVKHDISFFKSWLYMVTKNECFMLLRKKGKEIPYAEIHDTNQDEDSDALLIKEQKISVLEELIPSLKDEQQICIELFYLKELSYQQISDQLNLSLNQVKSAIQNGKRNLKLRLEERNEFK